MRASTDRHREHLPAGLDVENARVWGGLHFRTTMTRTAKYFPRIARDVGKKYFLDDAGQKRHKDDDD